MKNMKISKKTIILAIVLVIILSMVGTVYNFIKPSIVELTPASPSGVKIIAKTDSGFGSEESELFIKYPNSRKMISTGVIVSEDEGCALYANDTEKYKLEWHDDYVIFKYKFWHMKEYGEERIAY